MKEEDTVTQGKAHSGAKLHRLSQKFISSLFGKWSVMWEICSEKGSSLYVHIKRSICCGFGRKTEVFFLISYGILHGTDGSISAAL